MNVNDNNDILTLTKALHERVSAGHPVKFWLRDDDAIEPSEPLNRLLELTEKFHVPLTLAVIPAHSGHALAQHLANRQQVSVAVHGWSHTNYAGADEKKQELGNHRPHAHIVAELHRGYLQLAQCYPSQFVPVLVPPWNRISPEVVEHLGELGYIGLSTFGHEEATPVQSINTQVDIIDWKGTRGGRSVVDLVDEIVAQLHTDRSSIGILTHHLVHDEAAWQFLELLFTATSGHRSVRWIPVSDLLQR